MLKIMVADDEYPIRKWFGRILKELPDIKVELVGMASNGEEALEIFRQKKPDVIFTDIKMPLMDGLELLKLIKKEQPKTDVVIITSYDEFAYAKEAIAQNAYDYVLKTEANSRMLGALLRKIQMNRQELFSKRDALKMRFEQEIFLNTLLQQKRNDCRGEELKSHGIEVTDRGMFAIAFHANHLLSERIPEIFMNESVENVIYYSYQKGLMVAIGNTSCIEQLAYQNQVIYQFAEKISRCFESAVGISGPYFQYKQLVPMITKSVQALNLSFYKKRPGRIYYARDIMDFEEIEPVLKSMEERIMEKVKNGEHSDLSSFIRELFQYLEEQSPGDVAAVKQFLFRVMSNVCQILCRDLLGLSEIMAKLYKDLDTCKNLEEVGSVVFAQLERQWKAETDMTYSPYVMKALEYIEKNYREIAYISEVAENVGLNEDYLGHLFKVETGVTVNQFLNSTRMNKAAWLLNNTQLKAYEVAYKVGYANSGYFSKLFKQRFGVSPYEFRNMSKEEIS